jgi:hypothetical protein
VLASAWRIAIVALAVTVAAAVAAVTPSHGHASATRSACGVELWSLKTLSDPQRNLVKPPSSQYDRRSDHPPAEALSDAEDAEHGL